jgi:hypothetical protein
MERSMDKVKVRLIDNSFSSTSKSASLREENKDVTPTYFQWPIGQSYPHGENVPTFYTDNAILTRDSFAPNAIAWLLEPRCLRPENYEAAKEKAHHFKAVLSYDQDFLDQIDNGRWFALGGSSIALEKWGIYPKTKDICMIVSEKSTAEGHRLRHEIAKKFGDRIDLYGNFVGKPFDSKFDILKDYRYCLVIESCWTSDYFSEKLIDALSVGCIPIYWSKINQAKYFHDSGIFTLGREVDFALGHLGWLIEYIINERFRDRTVFDDMSLNSEDNLAKAKQYRICENWIYENHGDLFDYE